MIDMNEEKKKKLISVIRIVSFVGMIALVLFLIIRFLPEVIELLKSGSEKEMEEYLKSVGKRGLLILVVLQFLQTVTIVFPGIPIYMASGIVYGKIKGTIICYLTYVVSNVIVFVFSRRMREATEQLFHNQKNKGIVEIAGKTKNPARLIMLLCILPVIPNGIIPHIAARTKLDRKRFLGSIAVGCIPGIFLFVCCGDLLINGHYKLILILIITSTIGAVVVYISKNKILSWINKKCPSLLPW